MSLGIKPYARGLLDIGNGAYAWMQPDGGWGWSNAGLITDGDQSLLVDTLFDLANTREMLSAMRKAVPHAAKSIGTLVNTHHNGDHCYGNELVGAGEIISSAHAAEEMKREAPAVLQGFMKAAPGLGQLGGYLQHAFGAFDFDGITQTLPTKTFSGRLTRQVGNKRVELIEVGPAHTGGDILVHVPGDRTIFTGDILFIEGTPIMWAGPVANWITACDTILELDCETVVPGHGPITDAHGVRAVRSYLCYIHDEARKRFDAGMKASEAARDIALRDYDSWGDAERVAVNVASLYREFSHDHTPPNVAELFGQMAQILERQKEPPQMTITLYEHPLSPYAQKNKIALYEKGVAFELKMPTGIGSGHADTDFLAANPRAEVPALIDDGFAIFNSTIILEYIEEKFPSPSLLPRDPKLRAQARMIEEAMDTHYEPINWGMGELRWFKRAEGEAARSIEARAAAQARSYFTWLERHLGTQPWFNGETFGWADLSVIPYINGSSGQGIGPEASSKLGQWQARANARPSVQKTMAAAAESIKAMAQVSDFVKRGLFKREYRDHRLEWMIRSGGLDVVLEGIKNDTIRFSHEFS